MARIIVGAEKTDPAKHPLKEHVLNNDTARHIIAMGLALVLVVMVVIALLLSANEGALS